jgi:hypothetical protein
MATHTQRHTPFLPPQLLQACSPQSQAREDRPISASASFSLAACVGMDLSAQEPNSPGGAPGEDHLPPGSCHLQLPSAAMRPQHPFSSRSPLQRSSRLWACRGAQRQGASRQRTQWASCC